MAVKIENLYDYLANEEDARVCKEIPDSACKEVPGNFFKILFAKWLTKTGDALSSTKVVLPWLLSNLGAPAFFLGLLVPIRESGSLLPQLLMGGWVRRFEVRKTFFVLGSLLQGGCVIAMALVALSLNGANAGWAIVGLLLVFSLARGLCSVASKDVLGKTIPKTRRGMLNGYSASGAGVITLVFGAILLVPGSPQKDFAVFYLFAAGVSWFVAAAIFALVKETAGDTEGGGNAIKNAFENLSLLSHDKSFRLFVITRSFLVGSGLSTPYFVLMANTETGDSLFTLGILLVASGLASLLSGPFWGKFSDKSSRRVMQVCAVLTAVLCILGAVGQMVEPGIYIAVTLYFALTITHQGVRLGRKTYLVDLADGNKRTDYVSVSNTVIGILLLFTGGVSAALAQLGLVFAFGFFALLSALAAALCHWLPEVSG